MSATVLLAGGGTGGHVFPSLAVAAALREARPDLAVEFVGTPRGLEARLVPADGWLLHHVDALPFERRLSVRTLRLPVTVGRAARDVARLIRRRGVVAACVFGGYVSVPLALAARWTRTPLVVHEQNAVPGLANRLAARWAETVAASYPTAAERFAGRRGVDRVVLTGNPVRPGLAGVDRAALRGEALAAFGLEPDRRTLLVFGGSQGARSLNRAAVASVTSWNRPETLQILHAAGRWEPDEVRAAWDAALSAAGGPVPLVRCVEFIERMDLAYAAADVVACRAGASTIAELTVLGLPSVLVPFPTAIADEQTENAVELARIGGAVTIPDADLDGPSLAAAAEAWLTDDRRRAGAARAARSLGRPDAAASVAGLLLDAAGPRAAGPRSADPDTAVADAAGPDTAVADDTDEGSGHDGRR